jgi:hypothetical protein
MDATPASRRQRNWPAISISTMLTASSLPSGAAITTTWSFCPPLSLTWTSLRTPKLLPSFDGSTQGRLIFPFHSVGYPIET